MPTPRSKPLTRLALTCMILTFAIPLASCATTTDIAVPTTDRVACQAFKPIYWSGKDTPATAAEVKEHNAAWKAICAAKAVQPKAKGASFKDRWFDGVKIQLTAFQ